ncbi:MAG: HYR domain-containing protein, partial [Bacteroidota bacterium]
MNTLYSRYIGGLFLFLCTLLSSQIQAQVSQGFEGFTTQLDRNNCTDPATCGFIDPVLTPHTLVDQTTPTIIPVSGASSGMTLGFSVELVNTTNGATGFSDGDYFGVAATNIFTNDFGAGNAPPEGSQGFFMEDVDGLVTMTFDDVDLSGTTNPEVSLRYFLDGSWETDDLFQVSVVTSNCGAATTLDLINTSGQDIDLISPTIEGSWLPLSINLSSFVGCTATLTISFSANAASEELGIDNIIFTEGVLAGSTICPTVGSVSTSPSNVCEGDQFDITASGLANMSSANNMEADFGIEFVYFSNATGTPYTGGTSLGTVPFGSLTAGNTVAALVGASIPNEDPSGFIYAILSPDPSSGSCRPSAVALIEIDAPGPAPMIDDVQACTGDTEINPATAGTTPNPVQFWIEDFAEDGVGAAGNCTTAAISSCTTNSSPANGQWSITGDASDMEDGNDFIRVTGGRLMAQDVGAEVCFLSEVIDISAYSSVDFSVFVDEDGDHEDLDYVDISLIVDGGTPSLIPNWMMFGDASHTLTGDNPTDADFDTTTVTQTGLSGGTLQIQICVLNNAGPEMIFFDDITLTGTPNSVLYNFYDADPGAGPANLLAGPAASYDPGMAGTFWVTEDNSPCESEAAEVVITTSDTEPPTISNCPTTLSDGVVGINSCLNATPNYTVFVTLDDNCSDPADITIEQFPPTGTQLGVGMFEIKLVAMDEAGLFSDTCRFTLNNVDRTPPEITACVSPTT